MSDENRNDPTSNNADSVLDQLVGAGKKFSDVEALAKGKQESDAFIQKLTDELRTLKGIVLAQDAKNAKLEARLSILDRLGDRTDDNSGTEDREPDLRNKGDAQHTTVKSLSEADVVATIQQHEQQKKAQENRRYVDETLSKMLGAEATGFIRQRAAELNISPEMLVSTAQTSPKAFFSLVGLAPENATSSNSMYKPGNAPANATTKPPVRNSAYYAKLQQEMGTKKFVMDKALQVQMHQDMRTLGDAFDA